ncbi:hypothetical protein [Streptomyces sp. NPDC095613]|uniref:hypothetical protein n=1 Tax=Streptomyces sp. NPDC095613 TaxID=3155540 RepID=UPI00331CA060
MHLPVDDATLTAWSSLLGLTAQQRSDVLEDIEETLRRGYTYRPIHVRHLSFEEHTAGIDANELALMFLGTGLRHAGHPDAASSVEIRGLIAQLRARFAD